MPRLRADEQLLALEQQRLRERLEDPLGGVGGVLRAADVLEQDRELVAAEARGGVAGADARVQALGDLEQHLVAGGVAEAVVDRLEVVEVDEDDGQARALAAGARDGVAHALDEQRAVGEVGDGVVEGLVGELLLERLALADVAAVEHDAADVLVVEQVGVEDLELAHAAVGVAQAALERLGAGRRASPGRRGRAGGGPPRRAAAAARSGCRRASSGGSRARARSRGSGRRRGRSSSRTVMRSLECWTSEPKRASLVRRWTSSVSAALSSASETWVASAARLLCSARGDRAGGRRREQRRGARRGPTAAAAASHCDARDAELLERVSPTGGAAAVPAAASSAAAVAGVTGQAAPSSASATTTRSPSARQRRATTLVARERAGGDERGAADLLAAGGGDEVGARGAEDPLAGHRALLLAHEAGHAGDHEPEQEDRGDDDHEQVVAVVDDLEERHDGRDQRGAGEQREPQRRQARVAVRRGRARARASTGAARRRPTAGRS